MIYDLVFWSWISMIIRSMAVVVLFYVILQQIREYRREIPALDFLKPLKMLLLGTVVAVVASNIPIIMLNIQRIYYVGAASGPMTSFATVSNAVSMFLVAVMLYLIYKFK